MWLKHQFETKMSLIDVKKLNNSLGTGYGQRECTKHKGLHAYFGPRYCHRPLMNSNYDEGEIKYRMEYYCQTYSNPELLLISHPKANNAAREALDITRSINSNYMEFVGYKTCSKVIWTSGTMKRHQTIKNDKNEIKHQTTKYSYCPFGFTNTPHKDRKDTFNEKTMKEDINCLRILKSGKVAEYIEKVKRHF